VVDDNIPLFCCIVKHFFVCLQLHWSGNELVARPECLPLDIEHYRQVSVDSSPKGILLGD
jgi:hypothetical protein